jgi:hypothetical protein
MKRRAGCGRRVARGFVAALAGSLALACSKKAEQSGAPSPKATQSAPSMDSAAPFVPPAPVASGLPDPKAVSVAVNPLGEKAYAGPVGIVRGRVVAKGDPPPDQPAVVAKAPANCTAGREAYGKLFRVGPEHGLADALVAVTGFKGYVPERAPAQRVKAKDCFFGTRTLALTYGQTIEVESADQQSYIPELLGEHGQPQIVATPGGGTISTVYPTRTGRYVLIDNLRLFMTAEVIVLKYATHAVTGLDGRFEITGVPVGEVSVNALLPATGGGAQRKVTVEADKPTEEVVLEVAFDADAFAKRAADEAADAGAPLPSGLGKHAAHPPAPSSSASSHGTR